MKEYPKASKIFQLKFFLTMKKFIKTWLCKSYCDKFESYPGANVINAQPRFYKFFLDQKKF